MGIKNFHIVFIAVSILASIGCGAWLLWTESGKGIENARPFGIVMLASAPVMLFYGVRFVRKMQREGLE